MRMTGAIKQTNDDLSHVDYDVIHGSNGSAKDAKYLSYQSLEYNNLLIVEKLWSCFRGTY